MKPFTPLLAFIISCLLISCGKHVYLMKGKEINKYAKQAKEVTPAVFAVLDNGDTLTGATLKKKRNILNGKQTWLLDGKPVEVDKIVAYQDKYGFRLGDYSRLVRGRMNVYLHQIDNSRLETRYNSTSKQFESVSRGHVETSFFMGRGDAIISITYNSLTMAMSDCNEAAKQVQEEFGSTIWKRKPDLNINDYRAIIRIMKIYNGNCK